MPLLYGYKTFKYLIFYLLVSFFFIQHSLSEITFQEILEDPSNLELNLNYAKEQEKLGKYKATLATVERLNMLYPVNTDLKLYLISILLKLDSEAKLQLMLETMLQDPNTSEETREYIEETLKTIRKQSEPKGKWFAFADLNYMQKDHSNIDGVSKTKTLWRQDSVGPFPGTGYDKTYARGASITVGKNLDSTSAISFNGGGTINTQNKEPELENDVSFGSISYSKIFGKNYFIPFIYYSRASERFSPDSNSRGLGFNNTYNIDKVQTFTYGSAFSTTTINSRDDTKPDAANNEMYTANIGYNYTFSDINLIGSKLLYTRKKAKDDYNSYRGPGINFNYTRLLPFGTLKIDKTFQTNTYNARDFFINTMTDREDDLYTSAIQLTGRINQLLPFLDKIDPKGQFFYNLNYTQLESDSTLLNNSAIRKTTSFNIIKRFSLYE